MNLETIWEATLGLIIEDGWIALGAVGALTASWLVSQLARTMGNEGMLELVGPLLMAMVVSLILTNTYAAGRNAARKQVR